MASATSHLLKPLSMSIPTTLFTPKTSSYPLISITPKPIKLTHLSSSGLFHKFTTHIPSIVTFVAQYAEETAENDGGGDDDDGAIPEPDEEAKLFVGNLPYDLDEQQLAQLFDQAGTVEVSEVIYNRETARSRGFGFVTMSTVEEAENAVEKFNGYDVNGRLLTVNKAAPRGTRQERPPRVFEPSFRIYVGNLPWQIDDARLEQVFSEHGKVVDAKVVFDRETGRSRGFGFVTMSSETELDDAIAALDGQSLDGRSIRVNRAEERPRRSNF